MEAFAHRVGGLSEPLVHESQLLHNTLSPSGLEGSLYLNKTYVASTGQSKLSLKGVDAGLGSVLTVTLHNSEIATIKGKVSGQTVSF